MGKKVIGTLRSQLERWQVLRESTVNWKIFQGMITVGGFGLIVSLASAGKELVIAGHFGTSDAMDAYLLALLLPALILNTLSGSFEVSFVPEYIKVRETQGLDAARALFSNTLALYLVILLVISLVLFLLSSSVISILGAKFSPQKVALSKSLFVILIPSLLLGGIVRAWGSLLNAGERFALNAIAPLIVQVVTVLVLVLLGALWGIYSLAFGLLAGITFQSVFLMWMLKTRGFQLFPKWQGLNNSIMTISRQYVPMIVGLFLMGSTVFVDQAMAARLGPGSVSVLNYGNRAVVFFTGLGSVALSTAILPHFSKMVAREDWLGIRHTLRIYGRMILMFTVPITLGLVYFSEPLVRFIFERGAFTASDTPLVAEVQSLYFLQLPFYLLGIMGVRLLSALSKNAILMVISGVNLVVNIIGNFLFMEFWGVAGIGLSTSLVYVISTVLIFVMLRRQLRQNEAA